MRIPIEIVNEQLEVNAIVHAPKCRIGMALVDFVVDTGSNVSFISYKDALRLNIPFNTLKFREHMHLGGTKFNLCEINSIELSFDAEGNENCIEKISLKTFSVATTAKKTEEGIEYAKQIPSLLGLDFLRSAGLALYANPSKNIAYLEREG
ncbi:hypothetical protein COV61_03810 [Candidatus Micrarchaeota archaeon CG11_big_fil_rev_8_21_14_0_20_47_5]|nr:MAG: hypothetical protein COV61_03810 [Candidatus Micrarchaeota archaeon CG11_big_fil_rev_8_21_14_0_20_47_5]